MGGKKKKKNEKQYIYYNGKTKEYWPTDYEEGETPAQDGIRWLFGGTEGEVENFIHVKRLTPGG